MAKLLTNSTAPLQGLLGTPGLYWAGVEALIGALARSAPGPEVPRDHLDGACRGNREQSPYKTTERGPDDPAHLDTYEDRQQDPEGVQPHRPAHHDWIEDVVLELLIDEEHGKRHDPRRQRVQQSNGHSRHAGEQSAHKREEVHDAHPDREHSGV
jgi:hypothetical protein